MRKLNVIVPVKNEEAHVVELTTRINKALSAAKIDHSIIFVDDHSTDSTIKTLESLKKKYPVIIHIKQGRAGKAYSVLEGAKIADSDYLAFIDGDLEYAPEALPEMFEKILEESVGVVVANRKTYQASLARRLGSRVNALFFGKFLLGLNTDVQSGLKVFRKSILDFVDFSAVKPWTIDMPLLVAAVDLGYKIDNVNIDYIERSAGASKVNFFKTGWSIASTAIYLALHRHKIHYIHNGTDEHSIGAGVAFRKKRYITHSKRHHSRSAIETFVLWQRVFIALIVVAIATGLYFDPIKTVIAFTAVLSAIYFADVLFNLFVILKSLHFPPELSYTEEELNEIDDSNLPMYTVLCPLYKEAEVLEAFVKNIDLVDWPKDKLEVLLLLEADDNATIQKAQELNMPAYVKTVIVPHSFPKTKPKACNYGLHIAKGEYIVIYDAEDIPHRSQIKKVYKGFVSLPENVVCVQAKLNYHNPSHNLLTRLFTAEYSLWFDVVLPGFQSIDTAIPLGGTSNHFKTATLKKLQGWDAFNVTEDCDLGVILFREGYKTAIIDSVTLEEANSNVKNWIRQRSRWIKGYMQTYLVHMRNPVELFRQYGFHVFVLHLVVGARMYFMLINPILWILTASYFLLYKYVGPTIESFYPTIVFYMAAFSLIVGNFVALYNYMIGCAKRGHWELIKYVFFVPFYWVLVSISAVMAAYQLIVKPHFWEKTNHGLHLKKKKPLFGFANKDSILKPEVEVKLGKFGKLAHKFRDSIEAGGLIAASMICNVLNYGFNIYLTRKLTVENFGTLALLGSFLLIFSILWEAFERTVSYVLAVNSSTFNKSSVTKFWNSWRNRVLFVGIPLSIIWVLLSNFLTQVFKADSLLPILAFAPIWTYGLLNSIDYGYLNGKLKFIRIGVVLLAEAVSKFAASVLFVELGYKDLVYLSVPISLLVSAIVSYFAVFSIARKNKNESTEIIERIRFPKKFFIGTFAIKFSTIAYLSLDLIIAKIVLSPYDAGKYAMISIAGKIIYYMSSLFTQFILPMVGKSIGEGKSGFKAFLVILGLSSLTGVAVYSVFGYFGYITAPIIIGPAINDSVYLLNIFGLGFLAYSVAMNVFTYFQVKSKNIFTAASFVLAVIHVTVLYMYGTTFERFVLANAYVGILNLVVVLVLKIFVDLIPPVINNVLDFFSLVSGKHETNLEKGNLKILFFNWRDLKHVWAGGAEMYVHELAKELVNKGHNITVFCGNDGHNLRYEVIDGVQIVRRGGFYTVYFWAAIYYIFKFRGKFDVIIDSENGIPFFTPLFTKTPVVGLIHHIHQDFFKHHITHPAAKVAGFLEGKLMPLIYKNTTMITVSESSKESMLNIGFDEIRNDISIVKPGVKLDNVKMVSKTKHPTVIYLGRLKEYKSIDIAISAFKHVKDQYPTAEFKIVGEGDNRQELEKLTQDLGLMNDIKFLGKVSDDEKWDLLASSWLMVQPSSNEGWGITVIEANASATPVVASNVKGLKDSVKNPHTGLLVKHGDVQEFADAMLSIISDKKVRTKMSKEAIVWASLHTWESSASNLDEVVKKVAHGRKK